MAARSVRLVVVIRGIFIRLRVEGSAKLCQLGGGHVGMGLHVFDRPLGGGRNKPFG